MVVPTAAVVVVGTIIAALLALIGTLVGQQATRIRELERKVDRSWSYNRRMWVWARTVIDLYLMHRRDGSPDLPALPEEDIDD